MFLMRGERDFLAERESLPSWFWSTMETGDAAARSNNRAAGQNLTTRPALGGLPDGKRRFDLMELLDEVGKKESWTDVPLAHCS